MSGANGYGNPNIGPPNRDSPVAAQGAGLGLVRRLYIPPNITDDQIRIYQAGINEAKAQLNRVERQLQYTAAERSLERMAQAGRQAQGQLNDLRALRATGTIPQGQTFAQYAQAQNYPSAATMAPQDGAYGQAFLMPYVPSGGNVQRQHRQNSYAHVLQNAAPPIQDPRLPSAATAPALEAQNQAKRARVQSYVPRQEYGDAPSSGQVPQQSQSSASVPYPTSGHPLSQQSARPPANMAGYDLEQQNRMRSMMGNFAASQGARAHASVPFPPYAISNTVNHLEFGNARISTSSSLSGALGNNMQQQTRPFQPLGQQRAGSSPHVPALAQSSTMPTGTPSNRMNSDTVYYLPGPTSAPNNINSSTGFGSVWDAPVMRQSNIEPRPLSDHSTSAYIGSQGAQMDPTAISTTTQLSGQSGSVNLNTQPSTPPQHLTNLPAPVTPASAKKDRLARDILRALGRPSKRKASRSPSPARESIAGPSRIETPDDIATASTVATDVIGIGNVAYSAMLSTVDVPIASSSTQQPVHAASLLLSHSAEPYSSDQGRSTEPMPVAITIDPEIPESASTAQSQFSYLPSPSGADPVPTTIVEPKVSEDPLGTDVRAERSFDEFEDAEEPLFLPSPVASSPELESIALPSSSKQAEPSIHVEGPTPGLEVYVEIPVPLWLQKMRKGKGKEKESASLGTHKKSEQPRPALGDEKGSSGKSQQKARDFISYNSERHILSDAQKKLAIETETLAAKRLIRSKCKWYDCPVVANSPMKLRQHVREHTNQEFGINEKVVACQWSNCARRFVTKDAFGRHVENHVRKDIQCPYKGCEGHFEHPHELQLHVETGHDDKSELRRSAAFIKHEQVQTLPPLGTMWAYRVENIPVKTQPISKEGRAKLGPWVVKNMFGIVNFNVQKHKKKLRSGRVGDAAARLDGVGEPLPGTAPDKYDFLEPWTNTYPPACVDLESAGATADITAGIALVPDRAGARGPLRELELTALAHRATPSVLQKHVVQAQAQQGEERESEEPPEDNEGVRVKMELTSESPVRPERRPPSPVHVDGADFIQDDRYKAPTGPLMPPNANLKESSKPEQAGSLPFSQSTALVPYDPRINELYKFILRIRRLA